MRTKSTTKEEAHQARSWYVVDADGKVLGRIASEIAKVLRGKHTPRYTPHVDAGDFVVVVNAGKVVLTGRKETGKTYYRHTGWVGGVKAKSAGEVRQQKPEELVKMAVKGMLPKGPLGRQMFSKLKVYAEAEHPHAAQQPQQLVV